MLGKIGDVANFGTTCPEVSTNTTRAFGLGVSQTYLKKGGMVMRLRKHRLMLIAFAILVLFIIWAFLFRYRSIGDVLSISDFGEGYHVFISTGSMLGMGNTFAYPNEIQFSADNFISEDYVVAIFDDLLKLQIRPIVFTNHIIHSEFYISLQIFYPDSEEFAHKNYWFILHHTTDDTLIASLNGRQFRINRSDADVLARIYELLNGRKPGMWNDLASKENYQFNFWNC